MAFENIYNYECPECGTTDCRYVDNGYEKVIQCKKCKKMFTVGITRERPSTSSYPQLRCPKCGSTAITTGARGVNGFWGFIGASKTVNRCGSCGNTWTPKG